MSNRNQSACGWQVRNGIATAEDFTMGTDPIVLQNNNKSKKGRSMSNYTEEQLGKIWKKGVVVGDLDSAVYRTDAAGGLMKRSLYGKEGNLGWEVDHIYSKEKLKGLGVPENRWDDMVNLRPMNAKNNVAKGESYPKYKVAVQYNNDKNAPNNVEVNNKTKVVDKTVQNKIRENYSQWWSN